MLKRLTICVCLICLPISASSFNEDLSEVLFEFDNIPCGEGSIQRSSVMPFPTESALSGLPVLSHIYIRNHDPNLDRLVPLDVFVLLHYYRYMVENEVRFSLVGTTRSYFLGSTSKEISDNYNKIQRDLIEVLGPPMPVPQNVVPHADKTYFWFKRLEKNQLGIRSSMEDKQNKKFGNVEITCVNEFERFTGRERKMILEKKNGNLFK